MSESKGISITLKSKASLLAATIIWGVAFSFMKSSIDSVPTHYLLAIRFIGAFLLLAAIFFKKFKKTNVKYIYQGAILGFLLYGAYAIQTYGLVTTTPGKNAFLTSTYCIMVPFLYWIIKRKKPDLFNFVAAFLCIIGIGFVSLNERFTIEQGDWLTILSGLFYALHLIFVAQFTNDKDSVLLTVYQFLFCGIFCLIGALCFEQFPSYIPTDAIWQIAFLAFLATGIALLLQNVGQKHLSAQTAAIFLSLESVFGVIFSIIFGYEAMTVQVFIGFVIIFIAILVSETKLSFIFKNKKA